MERTEWYFKFMFYNVLNMFIGRLKPIFITLYVSNKINFNVFTKNPVWHNTKI